MGLSTLTIIAIVVSVVIFISGVTLVWRQTHTTDRLKVDIEARTQIEREKSSAMWLLAAISKKSKTDRNRQSAQRKSLWKGPRIVSRVDNSAGGVPGSQQNPAPTAVPPPPSRTTATNLTDPPPVRNEQGRNVSLNDLPPPSRPVTRRQPSRRSLRELRPRPPTHVPETPSLNVTNDDNSDRRSLSDLWPPLTPLPRTHGLPVPPPPAYSSRTLARQISVDSLPPSSRASSAVASTTPRNRELFDDYYNYYNGRSVDYYEDYYNGRSVDYYEDYNGRSDDYYEDYYPSRDDTTSRRDLSAATRYLKNLGLHDDGPARKIAPRLSVPVLNPTKHLPRYNRPSGDLGKHPETEPPEEAPTRPDTPRSTTPESFNESDPPPPTEKPREIITDQDGLTAAQISRQGLFRKKKFEPRVSAVVN